MHGYSLPALDTTLESLPYAKIEDALFWGAHPADEIVYEDFIRCVLSVASRQAGHLISHGIVDWSRIGSSDLPLRLGEGWEDPDCLRVGGVSRVDSPIVMHERPAFAQVDERLFSFITIVAPTFAADPSRRDASLFVRLIDPMVRLCGTDMDGPRYWLREMFNFAAGHPVACVGDQRPRHYVQTLASAAGVDLVHLPMTCVLADALAGARYFRMLRLTRAQWTALEDRLQSSGLVREAARAREHRERR